MRARIFGALLIALVTLAALPAALRVQQAPGPGGGDGGPYCHQVREAERVDGVTFRAKYGVILDRAWLEPRCGSNPARQSARSQWWRPDSRTLDRGYAIPGVRDLV